ncbi:MAG: Ig-like domain-containing protein [Gemmatimonadaceae bacterium]
MRFIRSLLAGLVVGGLVSCGDLTEPEPLPTLEIVDGFGQEALGNETLRDSLRVRLRRADGTPVPGATVVWTVSSGAISPVQTVTDGSGQAAASWSFYNAATRW